MRTIKIRSIMWGKYPFKAISIADFKIKGLERFLVELTDDYYSGTYLVKTKNLTQKEEFKYGMGWVIDIEDYNVFEPYTPTIEHDKMNLKDSFNNVIESAKELPEKEELASYEEVSQMCKEAQAKIRENIRIKSLAV